MRNGGEKVCRKGVQRERIGSSGAEAPPTGPIRRHHEPSGPGRGSLVEVVSFRTRVAHRNRPRGRPGHRSRVHRSDRLWDRLQHRPRNACAGPTGSADRFCFVRGSQFLGASTNRSRCGTEPISAKGGAATGSSGRRPPRDACVGRRIAAAASAARRLSSARGAGTPRRAGARAAAPMRDDRSREAPRPRGAPGCPRRNRRTRGRRY